MNMRSKNFSLSIVLQKYGIFFVLLFLFILSALINPNFLTSRNLINISRQISIVTILAFGETLLVISGMLDLSNGSVLALAGVISVSTYKITGSLVLAVLVALIVSVICNIINGLMVAFLDVPPFIATLAMMTAARGLALLYTNGQNIYQIGNYIIFGQGSLIGIPTPIIFLAIILIITGYILKNTKFGRSLYAIGGNEQASIAAGINVKARKVQAYIINGLFVGIAAVVFMGRVNAGLPNAGQGFELEALSATVIGGTSFSGGIGTAIGTLVGSFIVGIINNIMNLTGVSSYLQQVVRGAIIAGAVIYDIKIKKVKVFTKKVKKA